MAADRSARSRPAAFRVQCHSNSSSVFYCPSPGEPSPGRKGGSPMFDQGSWMVGAMANHARGHLGRAHARSFYGVGRLWHRASTFALPDRATLGSGSKGCPSFPAHWATDRCLHPFAVSVCSPVGSTFRSAWPAWRAAELVFSFVESLTAIYAERFLGGLFAAAVTPVAAAAIGKFATTEHGRARRLSFVSMAGIAGFLPGPND